LAGIAAKAMIEDQGATGAIAVVRVAIVDVDVAGAGESVAAEAEAAVTGVIKAADAICLRRNTLRHRVNAIRAGTTIAGRQVIAVLPRRFPWSRVRMTLFCRVSRLRSTEGVHSRLRLNL
jgi:hypothetical protein